MRIEPPGKGHAADDRAEIKETRRHRGHAEEILRVQHSHDQRGQRDKQDEREHDAREQNGQVGLFRIESRRENPDELRREQHTEHCDRAHENNGERRDFVCQSPRRFLAVAL